MDCESIQMMSAEEPKERKECGKRGRKPGKKTSTEKIDIKAKLERSRQSARECRARKKLRYQYLEELVADREKAVITLRTELERYMLWSENLTENSTSNNLDQLLEEIGILKQEIIS
ncbi:REPTOR-binding partner [Scaptodrosophila lebanonensis]|uniref:REPTOR-binding partner n=1 Tax=Drosophila lebanonensis TaxID=7225 RepID=A0A6J2U0R5_DROLE|nr:REPTOR-binding partner [Scaptodrosophila lebanonensis]